MTVARITMCEYFSKEVGDDFEPKYSEVAPKSLPDANNLILVRTSETSGMSIAIYKDEKTAESTLADRKKCWKAFLILLKIFGTCRGKLV